MADWNLSFTSPQPIVLHQFGIHPWWAHEPRRPDDWLDQLREKLLTHPESGVGEIGLDWNKKDTFSVQTEIFKAQLELGSELGRVCSIHCVKAFGPLMQILNSAKPTCALVMHSFSGSEEVILDLEKKFPNQVYYSVSAQCPRDAVLALIPPSQLLIETDSPDQQMRAHLGSSVSCPEPLLVNDCSQLGHVAARVARVRGLSVEAVVRMTSANAIRAFT